MPTWPRYEIITEAPRSLKLPVGENHSNLQLTVPDLSRVRTSGVNPSPRLTGRAIPSGRAARYRHIDRTSVTTSARVMPAAVGERTSPDTVAQPLDTTDGRLPMVLFSPGDG